MPINKAIKRAVKSVVKKVRKSHGVRYPWDDWFAQGKFRLLSGRDYTITTNGMKGNALQAARARGIKLSFQQGDNFLVITVKGRVTSQPKRTTNARAS